MRITELDTPAVLVDVDIMEGNLRRLGAYCAEHRLRLRPHTKTHKIPELARRQIEHGAVGTTVAKLGDAEVMADAGFDNIFISVSAVRRPEMAPPVASGISRFANCHPKRHGQIYTKPAQTSRNSSFRRRIQNSKHWARL